jgi:hypothetical protein
MVTPVLERWRHATKNPNAKLIFICHLMGGHIARYFLEMLGATLALHVVCHGEDGQPRCNPKLMKALGDGRYQTKLDGGRSLPTVQSATPARPIDPIWDWTLVWNANAI